MKKIMFCMAFASMFAFVACNNAQTTEENTDTTAAAEVIEEQAPVMEETADSTAVAEVVTEAAAQ